jgi:hypothetical protein
MIKLLKLQLIKVVLLFCSVDSVFNYQEITNVYQIPLRLGNECDIRVSNNREFNTCRHQAFDERYNYDIKERIKSNCCLQWNLIECQQKSVYKLCDRNKYKDDFKEFMTKKDDWIYQLERQQCVDYPYGSYKCRFSSGFPTWAIALIIFVGLLIVVVLGSVLFCFIVRKKGKR